MIFVLLFYFAVVNINIHNITVNLLQDSTAEFQCSNISWTGIALPWHVLQYGW